jgi:hypothetical protein
MGILSESEQENIVRTLRGWQFVRGNHCCLYDRGSADSYYCRPPRPHYGGVGGDSGPRMDSLTADEVAEYMAGYDWNERHGDKKSWD